LLLRSIRQRRSIDSMQHIQPELELALLHIRQVEQRVAEQQLRVARLRSIGAPTDVAEELLRTLQTSHDLLKRFLAHVTGPVEPDKMSD
jgi:hypothetical protein